MDFLKYLDILIALAVVMLLLSPIVTAITHLYMVILGLRSAYLEKGLQALIMQLNVNPRVILRVQDPQGNTVRNVTIDPLETMPQGATELDVPNGLEKALSRSHLSLKLTGVGGPLVNHKVVLTLVPQKSSDSEAFNSQPSDKDGKTTIIYTSIDAAAFVSRKAQVTVRDPAGTPTQAKLTCKFKSADGTEIPVAVDVGGVFECPPNSRLALNCPIECVISHPNGVPLTGYTAEFKFLRNREFDVTVEINTDANGNVDSDFAFLSLQNAMSIAQAVAGAVLLHPMIARARSQERAHTKRLPILIDSLRSIENFVSGRIQRLRNRKGEVVVREELIRILLEFAANEGAGADLLDESTRKSLRLVLAFNGVPAPAQTLAAVREEAQKLEKDKPELAAHVRHANAILTAAASDFVGKVNHWFDQTMDRVTQRYASRARLVTVAAAFVVAVGTQINSWDLLKRLASDDNLRAALVTEAKDTQTHIENMTQRVATNPSSPTAQTNPATTGSTAKPADAPPAVAPSNASDIAQTVQQEIQNAQGKRDEIEQNIAKLRKPGIAVLPDHFVWQKIPQARLLRNPTWKPPYPAKFELVTGGASYSISPKWKKDVLEDLKTAIDASGAPVTTMIDSADGILFTAKSNDTVQVVANASGAEKDLLLSFMDATQARLTQDSTERTALGSGPPNQFAFFAEDPSSKPPKYSIPIEVAISKGDTGKTKLDLEGLEKSVRAAIEKQEPAGLKAVARRVCKDNTCTELTITAFNPQIHTIQLWKSGDPFSNILDDSRKVSTIGWLGQESWEKAKNNGLTLLTSSKSLPVQTAKQSWQEFRRTLYANTSDFDAKDFRLDALVITSKLLGPIQLRHNTGQPETNILNSAIDNVWDGDAFLLRAPYGIILSRLLFPPFGIILSWALLSLGAPFWYDMLKELMKLRPALAGKEEAQRKERQAEQPKPPAPPPTTQAATPGKTP